jgi:hypothetical protein
MFNPDGANQLQGENLRRLVDEVRREFFARGTQGIRDRPRRISSARVVTIEVYDGLSIDAQAAITADALLANDEIILHGDGGDVFACSDTARAFVADLICEIVCQELMNDPLVVMENDSREAMFDLD